MKSGENWQEVSEKSLNIYTILYMHTVLGKRQLPSGDKILIVNNKFYYVYYFNHTFDISDDNAYFLGKMRKILLKFLPSLQRV